MPWQSVQLPNLMLSSQQYLPLQNIHPHTSQRHQGMQQHRGVSAVHRVPVHPAESPKAAVQAPDPTCLGMACTERALQGRKGWEREGAAGFAFKLCASCRREGQSIVPVPREAKSKSKAGTDSKMSLRAPNTTEDTFWNNRSWSTCQISIPIKEGECATAPKQNKSKMCPNFLLFK